MSSEMVVLRLRSSDQQLRSWRRCALRYGAKVLAEAGFRESVGYLRAVADAIPTSDTPIERVVVPRAESHFGVEATLGFDLTDVDVRCRP